jgi:hypothetical protein
MKSASTSLWSGRLAAVLAIASIGFSCGKSVQNKRTESPTTNANDSNGDSIGMKNNIAFELTIPKPTVDEVREFAIEDSDTSLDQPDAMPPISSNHIKIECPLQKPNTLGFSPSKLTLVLETKVDDKNISTEEATAINCGSPVKVRIEGLKEGAKYQLRADAHIMHRLIYAGSTKEFAIGSNDVVLELERIPSMTKEESEKEKNSVDVVVKFKEKQNTSDDPLDSDPRNSCDTGVICTEEYEHTVCMAQARGPTIECVADMPCPSIAPRMFTSSGSNHCRAQAKILQDICEAGLSEADIITDSLRCLSQKDTVLIP